jgi:hypothetical protein
MNEEEQLYTKAEVDLIIQDVIRQAQEDMQKIGQDITFHITQKVASMCADHADSQRGYFTIGNDIRAFFNVPVPVHESDTVPRKNHLSIVK